MILYKCNNCKLDKSMEYYYNNKHVCKDCYNKQTREWKRLKSGYGKTRENLNDEEIKHRDHINKLSKDRRKRNYIGYMISRAKSRAKIKNIEFNLDKDNVKIPNLCPALKIPIFIHTDNKPTANSASLDRLDNSKGYINDNINVISNRANTIKADATFEEFEAIYKWWRSEIKKKSKKCQNTT